MGNPWKDIPLSDYEQHMSLESVYQLQAMNDMMKGQFETYPIKSVMILGIAGGNGLEHIDSAAWDCVYGVDINPDYLSACRTRYPLLQNTLKTICADLTAASQQLPHADLLVANLLVEYIGYANFQRVAEQIAPQYISCGIQINTDASFVSDSPYLHVFDRLDEVHHQMESSALTEALSQIGYVPILQAEHLLPNGKKLVRLDFEQASAR